MAREAGSDTMAAPAKCQKCGKPLESGEQGALCVSCLESASEAPPMHQEHQHSSATIVGTLHWEDAELQNGAPAAAQPWNTWPEEDGRRYTELGELGRGGMGRVMAVWDSRLERRVALKQLSPGKAASGAGQRVAYARDVAARFLREAWVTGHLEHPSITTLHDIGVQEDGTLFYTMRYVRGRSLAEAIAGAHTMEQRLALLPHFVALCNAVAYAHAHGVVHRDLKPANVVIGDYGETTLVDWGLAKSTRAVDRARPTRPAGTLPDEHYAPDMTSEGQVLGSPAYISPEQARGELNNVDERSDIFSLGAVLFEILTRQTLPDAETSIDMITQCARGRLRRPLDIESQCPAGLASIIDRATAYDRAERYASARELGEAVQFWHPGTRTEQDARLSPVVVIQRFTDVLAELTTALMDGHLDREERARLHAKLDHARAVLTRFEKLMDVSGSS